MTPPPIPHGQLEGYKSQRLTADGAIAGGVRVVLESINFLSGATAGIVTWYEDDDAATAGNKKGGLPGTISTWTMITGIHQSLDKLFIDIDINVTEVIITYLES